MGSMIPLARSRELALRRPLPLATASHQLDLVLDDERMRGMTPTERQAVLQSLAHLLLEAAGVAIREAGDDHE
jgi:hypothetical protein